MLISKKLLLPPSKIALAYIRTQLKTKLNPKSQVNLKITQVLANQWALKFKRNNLPAMYKKNHLAKIVKRIVLRFLRCSTKARAAVLTWNMHLNSKTTFQVKSWIPRTTACYRLVKKCRKSPSRLLKTQISQQKAHHLTKKLKSKNLNRVYKHTYKWVFIPNRPRCGIINL
jgi:hypothetical protein